MVATKSTSVPATTMPATEEQHWTPTRAQKAMATVEEMFGRAWGNRARILESKTTRTGVPYGPGGPVLPPAEYYAVQPPNISPSAMEERRRSSAASATSGASVSAAAGSGSSSEGSRTHGEMKAVHGAEVGLGRGHHGPMQGSRGLRGQRAMIGGK